MGARTALGGRYAGPNLRVAITGNMGSGKSSLATLLRERGAGIVDADERAAHLLESDGNLVGQLADAFGDDLVDDHGRLDRRKLAHRAFSNDETRQHLDRLLRKPLERLLWETMDQLASTARIVILDAPLVFEWGIESHFSALIVVTVDSETALLRLQDRGVSEDEARRRRSAQWPAERQSELADFVVDNNSDLTNLEAQADVVWQALQDRVREGMA